MASGEDDDIVDLTSPSPVKPSASVSPLTFDLGPSSSSRDDVVGKAPAAAAVAAAPPGGRLVARIISLDSDDELEDIPSFYTNTFRRIPPGQGPASNVRPQGAACQPEAGSQPLSPPASESLTPPANSGKAARDELAAARADRKRNAEEQKATAKRAKAEEREADKAAKEAGKMAAKAQKKSEKEMQQQVKGKFALQEIRVGIGKALATDQLGWNVMKVLGEESLQVDIVDKDATELRQHKVITWSRVSVASLSQASQAGTSNQGQPGPDAIPYVMVALTGPEFVAHVQRDGVRGLIQSAAKAFPSATLGLLITGLRSHVIQAERNQTSSGFSRQKVEDCLAVLNTHYEGVYHKLATDIAEAAEHVKLLTIALAKQPYEDQENFFASFGGGTGKAKVAQAPAWCKALTQLPNLAPSQAEAVASYKPSLGALISAYLDDEETGASKAEKGKALVGIKGRDSAKGVGLTNSKKIMDFFLSEDPDMIVK